MAGRTAYTVYYTEQAAVVRDELDAPQRAAFDKGITMLTDDPFPELSRPISSTGDDRTIRLTQNILIEYTVSVGRLLIFVVMVFNDKDIYVTGE
ncbi:type II toxin-antitoxin system RelE family toxin [Streptomyces phaeofaciens]|uniref:type II toxin-antitoxin system RelE family toxin n=1 Tax=Streptomyces phaeofaciens TaxID=68254 RepID=UPI0036749A11